MIASRRSADAIRRLRSAGVWGCSTTATVTANTDVTLHALERDDFIAAVSDHPASAQAADTVIADRLGTAAPGRADLISTRRT